MALTAEEIRSHTGLAPELREVLIEMLAEIQSGGYVLPAATTSSLGGVKQAAAVPDPESGGAAGGRQLGGGPALYRPTICGGFAGIDRRRAEALAAPPGRRYNRARYMGAERSDTGWTSMWEMCWR